MKYLALLLFMPAYLFAQRTTEVHLDSAFQNAKKGIYWALSNIPEKKSSLSNDLIADDKLIASVKLEKEIYGVRIESAGVYETTEVKVTLFKSADRLLQEGYLKPDTLVSKPRAAEEKKSSAGKRTRKKSSP